MAAAQASGQPVPQDLQNLFAGQLQALQQQAAQLPPAQQAQLAGLLGAAAQSPILSQAQQQYVQTEMVPAIAQLAPQIIQGAAAEQEGLTAADLKKLLAGAKTPAQRIKILKQYMKQAQESGQPIPADLQNAFAGELTQLQSQAASLTPEQQKQLQLVLSESGRSPLLNDAQQTYVRDTMLPAVAGTPSVKLINALNKDQDLGTKLAGLDALLAGAKGKQVDGATKNAFAGVIQGLAGQMGNMTPEQQAQFNELLAQSLGGNALSGEQKNYVTINIYPQSGAGLTQGLAGLEGLIGKSKKRKRGKGGNATSDVQRAVFARLKSTYNSRPRGNAKYAASLHGILQGVVTANLLSAKHNKKVQKWMATLTKEAKGKGLKKGTKKRRRKKRKAKKLSTKERAAASNKIAELEKQLKNKNLTPEQRAQLETELNDAKESLQTDRALRGKITTNELNAAKKRAAEVEQLLKNPSLTPEQKAQLEDELDGIKTTLNAAQQSKSNKKARKLSTAEKVTKIQELLAKGNLTPEQKAKLVTELQKYANEIKDPATGKLVQGIINQAVASGAFSKAEVASLKALSKQVVAKYTQRKVNPKQAAADAAAAARKNSNFMKIIEKLNPIIANARPRTFPKQQAAYAKLVQEAFDARNKDLRNLMALEKMLIGISKTSMLNAAAKQVAKKMLAQVRTDMKTANKLVPSK